MKKDPYEKVYDALAELHHYQTILRLNNLEDSESYKKIDDYIKYLNDAYLTPRTVDEVFAYKVLPGKITHTEFREWLRIIGREDLLDKYYPNLMEVKL
ncbi:MAG: hypothetical protein IJF83_06980 [Methanobrevibacter sp.]|nr:hypothetical protein [Methanobrevibacter sp.]